MQQQRTLRRAQRESDAGNPQVTPRLARPRRTTFEAARGDSSISPLRAESRAVPMAQDGRTSCAEANRRPIEASKTSTALASAWAGSSHYRNPLFRHNEQTGCRPGVVLSRSVVPLWPRLRDATYVSSAHWRVRKKSECLPWRPRLIPGASAVKSTSAAG